MCFGTFVKLIYMFIVYKYSHENVLYVHLSGLLFN